MATSAGVNRSKVISVIKNELLWLWVAVSLTFFSFIGVVAGLDQGDKQKYAICVAAIALLTMGGLCFAIVYTVMAYKQSKRLAR